MDSMEQVKVVKTLETNKEDLKNLAKIVDYLYSYNRAMSINELEDDYDAEGEYHFVDENGNDNGDELYDEIDEIICQAEQLRWLIRKS